MEKSIRADLMEQFGISKEEANSLIKAYAINHKGDVNRTQIKKDVERIVNTMLHEVGKIDKNYDIRHELTECGKDRTKEAMMLLMESDEDEELVQQYLIDEYAISVGTWANTFYHATQKKLLEILDKGIEGYKEFVTELPYENINRVADAFDVELEVANFLALKGTQKDFQKFMTDIRPLIDTDNIDRRSCPSNLSDKIYTELQVSDHYKSLNFFNRDNIMRGLSAIHNDKMLTVEEKSQIQDLFIKAFLENGYDSNIARLCRTEMPQKFEILQEYLEMEPDISWEEKDEFLKQKALPEVEKRINVAYKSLLEDLEKEMQKEILIPNDFMNFVYNSSLVQDGKNTISLEQDEETKKTILNVFTANPITRDEMMIQLEGKGLNDIIDKINETSLNKAKEQLEKIAQQGIGETTLSYEYRNIEDRFRYSSDKEDVIGVLSDSKYSPYVVGGELTSDRGLTDLQVKIPYNKIYKDVSNFQLSKGILDMTPEQIQQFNHKAEPIKVTNHTYRYGKVDGYYTRVVSDFEVNGENYHMKDADWTNRGRYTVIWKGEEENYPEEAMGFSSSYSEWASAQRGVDQNYVLKLIAENPRRFSKYYEENKGQCDSCGLFPTPHIRRVCSGLMKMPAESKLLNLQLSLLEDKDSQKSDEEKFVDGIVESAKERVKLKEKDEQAKALLKEYEGELSNQGQSLDEN